MTALAAVMLSACGCRSRKVGAASAQDLELAVIDAATGKPCPEIKLEVSAGGLPVSSGVTGEDGRWRLTHSVPGPLAVRAEDPAGRLLPEERRIQPSGGAVTIRLKEALFARLAVRSAGGAALSHVEVTVWPLEGSEARFLLRPGEERFGPLPPGPVKLFVAAAGHVGVTLDADIKPSRKDPREADLREVRLSPGGTRLRGRVRAPPLGGPLEALLRFGDGAGQLIGIEADGSFDAPGLPEGASSRAMLVLRQGSREIYARDIEVGGGDRDLGTIDLGR